MNLEENIYAAKRISWIGVVANLLLSAIKFTVGYLGNSQVVVADAIHSLSDLGTDFIILIGVDFWHRPPDDSHPYGHRRIETLVSMSIGIILAFVAFGMVYRAITSFSDSGARTVSFVAIIGPILSIIVKGVLYKATLKTGNKICSQALIANALHHRSDVLSSIPALITVFLAAINPQWIYFDSLGSIIISGFILVDASQIIKPAIAELLDGTNLEENDLIKQEVSKINGVSESHCVRTRKHGDCILLDIHILVDPDISVRAGHDIAEQVKATLLAKNKKIIDIVVHVEPFDDIEKNNPYTQ